MSFKFTCPICNSELECDDSLENKITECPLCHNEVVPVKTTTEKNIAATNNSSKIETESMQKNQAKNHEKSTPKEDNLFVLLKDRKNKMSDFIENQFSLQIGDEFKHPLLSKIFRIFGWILLAFALINLLLFFMDKTNIIVPATLFISGLISLGYSQIIDFIGKICFNSDKILEIMRWQNRYKQQK